MTAQANDWLHYRGRRRMLHSFPLDPYLRELPHQPAFHMWSATNRRGYVAHWELRDDDTLWLTALQTRLDDPADPGLRAVFPDAAGPIDATWVSQSLTVPDGDQLRYVHQGYGSAYARELVLTVWRGRLVLAESRAGGRRVSGTVTPYLERAFGPEEGAFLRAVCSAPDDAAPRLVYADWLDERQDERAGVIRLAEQLRELAPESAAEERTRHREALGRGLRHGLWVTVMGYDELARTVQALPAGW
jgi:uncharacterized protein (TIGR02996 family)